MELIDKIDKLIIGEAAMGKVFMGSKVFGKQKSKGWFKYRGLIASIKSYKDMKDLLKKIELSFRKGDISDLEMGDLTNQALEKSEKL